MGRSRIDWPSLFMVVSFLANIAIAFVDPVELQFFKNLGLVLFILGILSFIYTLFYLRSGFFGKTEPRLDLLITKGPYRFCRHPQYLSFIIMIFGIDSMFGSLFGLIVTITLSIPSSVYRARMEDRLLKKRFGKEWEEYAERVGLLFPRLRRKNE
ncbi:MAG: isoprenylcysteine carboxylmethyltransferase family protein [archaeon]|nr:isoprenylcysteine carboxylmethyltransferase family protein [archaeon]MCP8306139.1 isoprenylcysteine carboxylmethyltransferase family protein [archaeon]